MAYGFGDGAADVASTTGTGAAAGAAVGGPWGAVIGGAAGFVGGLFKAWGNSNSEKEKRKIVNQVAKEYNASADEIEQMFKNYWASNPTIGTQSDAETYANLVRNYDPKGILAGSEPQKFEYDKTIDDFVDPYKDEIVSAAEQSVQHSAAGAGLGRGTGAAKAIATKSAEVNGQLADKAFNRMQADRAQTYNEWNSYIQQMQNYVNNINANTQYQIAQMGNLAQDYEQGKRQEMEDYAQMAADRANTNVQIRLAKV